MSISTGSDSEDNQVVVSGLTERPYTGQVLYLGELFNGVDKITVKSAQDTLLYPPTVTIGSFRP